MRRSLYVLSAWTLLLAAACGPSATPAPTAPPAANPTTAPAAAPTTAPAAAQPTTAAAAPTTAPAAPAPTTGPTAAAKPAAPFLRPCTAVIVGALVMLGLRARVRAGDDQSAAGIDPVDT